MKTVTVFVARRMGVFHAATLQAEAIDAGSAAVASRRCAAMHFGVEEAAIELTSGSDEHVMIAGVREPARACGGGPLLFIAIACGLLGLVALYIIFGGAR